MKRLLPALLVMMAAPAALAQTAGVAAADGVAAPAPANAASIIPPQTAPTSRPVLATDNANAINSVLVNTFPTLPPSRPCTSEDLWGYFRLEKLYEQPAGDESTDFQATPLQFLHFAADSTYRPLKLANQSRNRRAFYDRFKRKEGDPLMQYVVHEGFVYFYNDGNALDTQACFIVANDTDEFKKGRMLLMPPAPQPGEEVKHRVLRVYHNFNRPRGKKPSPEALKR
ncbi:MAG: hypothetical protein SFW63_03035 [Alphaproteobacteria bacterium]|nr:hypothetical protein [Alphaproteobacteria bacterium]